MSNFWQDLRYGLRLLAKTPGFTAITILTLALGIGANTALFSVVNGVILNPLPFPEPQQLVSLYGKSPQFEESSITYPNFLDWRRENRVFSAVAAYRHDDYNLTGAGEPEHLNGWMTSADFYPLLGVRPILGRTFRKEEDEVGAAPVTLISEGVWKRKFASSPDIIGRTLTLNGTGYTIVGVVPSRLPMFDPSEPAEIFVPIGQWNDSLFRDRKVGMGTQGIGRLKPGVTLAQARADMDSVAHNLAAEYPEADKNTGVAVVPLKQDIVGDVERILFVLLGAVGFVLLIACANVANLLLARSTGRAREFAIRVAMGASQTRVVRQLLTESVLLAVSGGILGLAIAQWGTRAVLAALPEALPRGDNVRIDGRVLLFMLGVSVLAGILFGLAPALKTLRPNLAETLKEGGRGSSGAHHRTQNLFVVVEMALSLVLLIGAGLMIRSLSALWHVKPGFNPHNVLTLTVGFPLERISTPAKAREAIREAAARFESIPGIEAASSMGGSLPMSGDSELPFWRAGQPKPATDSEMNFALFYAVQPDYLKVMGIPLLRGRFLSPQDDEKAPFAIVIDEDFARQFFPNQDPIGQHIHLGLIDKEGEIVGIAGHVKHWGLADTAHQNLRAEFYFPIVQFPDQIFSLIAGGLQMVVRTAGPPTAFTGAIRAASTNFDASQVVYRFLPMDRIVSNSIASQRFAMVLLAVFAALALVLSAVGIYGVISYVSGQRTHEIGIRMALGAQQRDVLRMVLGQGARLAVIGVGIGLAAALGLTRLMSKMIFGVRPSDPVTFAGVAAVLTIVALAACYIPARRAMRVDPMVALRYE
jgi:predicted permease